MWPTPLPGSNIVVRWWREVDKISLQLNQHKPQIAWKGISDILQFASIRFTRYIFLHTCVSGQETNQNTDIKYNHTEIQFFKKINTVNPHPYTHQMTPPMTASVTTLSYICKPLPLHASNDSFNDTLCDDNPLLHLRTHSRTHIRRLHLERHPVWQPGLGSGNFWPLHTPHGTSNDTLCVDLLHTPHDTSKDSLCDSPPPSSESTKLCEPPPPNLK